VQALLGIEHRGEPDQVLLVAPAAMVEDQESGWPGGARRPLGEG
jgi:hypothetical protein